MDFSLFDMCCGTIFVVGGTVGAVIILYLRKIKMEK